MNCTTLSTMGGRGGALGGGAPGGTIGGSGGGSGSGGGRDAGSCGKGGGFTSLSPCRRSGIAMRIVRKNNPRIPAPHKHNIRCDRSCFVCALLVEAGGGLIFSGSHVRDGNPCVGI